MRVHFLAKNNKRISYTYFALAGLLSLTLGLAACQPPGQSTAQSTSPENPQPSARGNQSIRPIQPAVMQTPAPVLPARTVKLRISIDPALFQQFGIKQTADLTGCAASLSDIQTTLTFPSTLSPASQSALESSGVTVYNINGQTILQFDNTLQQLSQEELLVEYTLNDLPLGFADGETHFRDGAGSELGFLGYNVEVLDTGGKTISVNLTGTADPSALATCPKLEAQLSGANISLAGGDISVATVAEPTPTPEPTATPTCGLTPDNPCDAIDPSPSATATPEPAPTPSDPSDIPLISNLSITSGYPLATLVITGDHFDRVTEVLFGTTSAVSFTIDSNTQITAVVPAISVAAQVRVTNMVGTNSSTEFFTPITGVRTLFVKSNGLGDGSGWANAMGSLKSAMIASRSGDQIWVASGTYTPDPSNRGKSFVLKNGVSVYGGFNGTESNLVERNWLANPTILSGDLLNNDDSETGNFAALQDNSYHVLVGASNAVLDGFTIQGGFAAAVPPNHQGGGMINNNSSPSLSNVRFKNNTSIHAGGGMANLNASSPTLYNVTFDFNDSYLGGGMYNVSGSTPVMTQVNFTNNAGAQGGGIFNDGVSPSLTGGSFATNSATHLGGAICNRRGSSPNISQFNFTGNIAGSGGAIYNAENSSPSLTSITFTNNGADTGGGIFNYTGSSPTLYQTTFKANTARFAAGAMFNYDNASPSITKSIFIENIADKGGAIFNRSRSAPVLKNVVIYKNQANRAGGMYNYNIANPQMWNVTFYNNQAGEAPDMYTSTMSAPVLNSCIIWNTLPTSVSQYNNPLFANSSIVKGLGTINHQGYGNLNVDPFFVDPSKPAGPDGIFLTADDGLRLSTTSPGKDFGVVDPNAPTLDILDVVRDSPPDMGAYEGIFDHVEQDLIIETIAVGEGVEVEMGDTVVVHYNGYLTDGYKFDSSYDTAIPFAFTLGATQVVVGFEQGVVGMKVGGTRRLIIPPHLGYGGNINGPIPPNSTLIFEVEMLTIQKP